MSETSGPRADGSPANSDRAAWAAEAARALGWDPASSPFWASGFGARALDRGVLAAMPGPSYETPAEVRFLAAAGVDAVSMSTVPEAIAVRHMGSRVLAISLVTNLAAGISAKPLSHAEVQETAAAARTQFSSLLDNLLPTLVA